MGDVYSTVPEVKRMRWLVRGAVLWSALIVGRLVYLQVYQHRVLVELAESQQERTIEQPAPRGTLLDRNEVKLAVSVPAESIGVNLRKLKDPGIAIDIVTNALHMKRKVVEEKFRLAREQKRGFFWVKRKLAAAELASLKQYNYDWMEFRSESKRVFPHGVMAAPVIGSVDIDGNGNAGVELSLQNDLRGVPGKVRMLTDVYHRGVEQLEVIKKPKQGTNIALTIDSQLQVYCDRMVEETVAESGCTSGTIVVMNPNNGEILAISSYPSFDPNVQLDPNDKVETDKRQHAAVTKAHDPGSVFKMFTLAAVLETTRLNADSIISCGNGTFKFGDQIIHDTHAYGALPMEQVIWKSSNIGAIHMGIATGRENLYEYLTRFGFGARTGIPIPAETRGQLNPLSRWSKGSLYYVAMGHEVSVSTIQLAQAASVFANGGFRVKPKLVLWKQAEGRDKEMMPESPRVRVIKGDTAAEVRRISEGVILYGTGAKAKLIGYTAGGKTGTAQMVDEKTGKYVKRYASSFLGYAPLNNPSVVVVATFSGSKQFGGVIAAPVFQKVTMKALRVLGEEPDVPQADKPAPVHKVKPEHDMLARRESEPSTSQPAAPSGREVIVGPAVPDFRGKPKTEVLQQAVALGMPVEILGQGLAREQSPPPGSALGAGERIKVHFAR